MADPQSISKTVTQMATQISVTLNWDVVVNYTEPAINNLLAQTFNDETKEQIRSLQFTITIYDPLTGNNVNINYDVGLSAPLLKFNSRGALGPTCNLTCPVVNGTVQVEGGSSADVPSDRYSIVIGTLMLATAEGSVDTDITPYGQSFVFNDKEQGCVIIDFRTSSDLTVDVVVDESSSDSFPLIDSYTANISQAIKKQLLEEGNYRYEIARVKADLPPEGMIQLQPKSFRFDAFLPSDDSGDQGVGVLTLFIQTRDENHGTQDNLATAWEYQWRKTLLCSPIPQGATASIIFSKYMIYESVIKPALISQGFSGAENLTETKGSLEIMVDTRKSVHRDKFDEKDGNFMAYMEYTADGVDLTLDPLKITLHENSGSAAYTTSWEFKYECSWSVIVVAPEVPTVIQGGNVTVTHFMPKDSSNPPNVVTFLDDYSLTMDCSVSKDDWGVKFESENPSWWEKLFGIVGGTPGWIQGLQVELPEFKLRLGSFNFFLTTNLLFPGDKKVIDIDKGSGLHIPADLYLVGTVVDKLE